MKQTQYTQNNYNINIAINRKTYKGYFGSNSRSYSPNKIYFQEKPTSSNFLLDKGLEKILY
jgi:hypothetical protein